jgi:glutaredoxin
MNIENPNPECFTIYSKSGCPNCEKVKKILDGAKLIYVVVECDGYLVKNRETFLDYMETLAGYRVTTFPIVFHGDRIVGGYMETNKYLDELEKKEIEFDADF